jgi:hypothetical protein
MLATEFQSKVNNSTQVECKPNQLTRMLIMTALKTRQIKEISPKFQRDKFQWDKLQWDNLNMEFLNSPYTINNSQLNSVRSLN